MNDFNTPATLPPQGITPGCRTNTQKGQDSDEDDNDNAKGQNKNRNDEDAYKSGENALATSDFNGMSGGASRSS